MKRKAEFTVLEGMFAVNSGGVTGIMNLWRVLLIACFWWTYRFRALLSKMFWWIRVKETEWLLERANCTRSIGCLD